MEKDKTVYVELLAALKTIKANGLEAKEKVEDEKKEDEKKEPEDKPLLAYYKGAVVVYTDGGAKENPGPSGCSCIIDARDYIMISQELLRRSKLYIHMLTISSVLYTFREISANI